MAIIKNQKTRPKGKYLFCLFFFQYQKRFKHLKIFHITHSYKQFLEQKGQIFKVLSHDPCHWTQTFYSPLSNNSLMEQDRPELSLVGQAYDKPWHLESFRKEFRASKKGL